MNNSIVQFTQELAQEYYDSTEQFPIDFDNGWRWLEYSRKDNAKANFIDCDFVEGIDYVVAYLNRQGCLTGKRSDQNGKFPEVIKMTCECFKQWGMMAGTSKGKEIRMYFLLCESRLKAMLKSAQIKQEPTYLPAIVQFEKILQLTREYKEHFGELNPTMQQLLKDHAGNALIDAKQLKSSEPQECWMGVVNFAKAELDFICPKKGEHRDTALGKWITWYHPHLAQHQEKRLCNETQQSIWVYPIHEVESELKEAVKAFIDHPNPGSQLRVDGAFKRK